MRPQLLLTQRLHTAAGSASCSGDLWRHLSWLVSTWQICGRKKWASLQSWHPWLLPATIRCFSAWPASQNLGVTAWAKEVALREACAVVVGTLLQLDPSCEVGVWPFMLAGAATCLSKLCMGLLSHTQRDSTNQLLPAGQLQICLEATTFSMSLVLCALDATLAHGLHEDEQDMAGRPPAEVTALDLLKCLAPVLTEAATSLTTFRLGTPPLCPWTY